jgi:filamentous hemagglutinin family protein
VFGKNAAVVIANPNGFGCDGCSFINTSKLTKTTILLQTFTDFFSQNCQN